VVIAPFVGSAGLRQLQEVAGGEETAGSLLQVPAGDEATRVDGGEAGSFEEFGNSGLGLLVVAGQREDSGAGLDPAARSRLPSRRASSPRS
jgi:hypothetical protein